jgi:hypothetical protein
MAYEVPKTFRGIENRMATGDSRKSYIEQMNGFERRLE